MTSGAAILRDMYAGAKEWQSLIAGMLGLAGGVLAFVGALRAANRQVSAADRQLAAAREARSETDKRAQHAVTLAIRLEALRIQREALDREKEGFPSEPGWSNMKRADALISTSPLMRFERPEITLLAKEQQDHVEALASALDEFNSHAHTLPDGVNGMLVDQRLLKLLEKLGDKTTPILRW